MARPERFELPTLWFEARCSIQLSYGRVSTSYREIGLAVTTATESWQNSDWKRKEWSLLGADAGGLNLHSAGAAQAILYLGA